MAVATWIYGDGMIILVEGQKILRWEVYIVIFLIRLTAAFVSYQLVKNIRYKIQLKDCFTLTFTFLIGFSIYILVNYNYLNLSRVVDIAISVSGIVLSLTFYITFIYAKNTLYLREQEQKRQNADCTASNSSLPTIRKDSKTRRRYASFTTI